MDTRDAAQRAAGQVRRQVRQQRDTAALVEGLDSDQAVAEHSKRTLSAMTAPPYDGAQIAAMAEGPVPRPGGGRRWWHRWIGRG